MLSTAVQDSKGWRVVILDETTVKVLSNVMRMSDLMSEHNIAVVENLNKNREPMRDIPGIYFVEPTAATVSRLAFDFGSRCFARIAILAVWQSSGVHTTDHKTMLAEEVIWCTHAAQCTQRRMCSFLQRRHRPYWRTSAKCRASSRG